MRFVESIVSSILVVAAAAALSCSDKTSVDAPVPDKRQIGDDTSVEDIRAQLDAVPGVSATFDASGKLQITADAGNSFSFSKDTSGSLAVLGVNSFFTGDSAADIAVREDVEVMLGRMEGNG